MKISKLTVHVEGNKPNRYEITAGDFLYVSGLFWFMPELEIIKEKFSLSLAGYEKASDRYVFAIDDKFYLYRGYYKLKVFIEYIWRFVCRVIGKEHKESPVDLKSLEGLFDE